MEINSITYLIVCPFVFLAGFVDSIAGGGGLISIPGYLIAGLPPVTASATNKISAGMGASVSLINYIKNKFVNFHLAAPCVIMAVIFSYIGAKVQMMIPEEILKIILLVALPITMLIVLNKESLKDNNTKDVVLTKKVYLLSMLVSMALGFYDGIYGPATGTFLLIFFVKIVGMNIREANGLTKMINFSTNMGALISFLMSGKALIILGIVAGLFNMLGNYFGSHLFLKKGADIARPIIIVVMLIFVVRIILELLHII